jgi:SecD/SecF fusion protein
MQNKGLIKFFAILFALVSIYQLSFIVSSKIKTMLKLLLTEPEKEARYLDSISKEKVFNLVCKFYFECKDKINKGLDLEGGINVILQISVKDI